MFAAAAEAAPSVVLLDELDSLAPARVGGEAGAAGSNSAESGMAARVVGRAEEEVQADCVCIVYPGLCCYRGRRRCKLTVFV